MLRECLISEAMHGLMIPTSRSLAIVTTGEKVPRERMHDGAILTRVASSHIRVGTFEFARKFTALADQQAFFRYTLSRHDPELLEVEQPVFALELIRQTLEAQAAFEANALSMAYGSARENTARALLRFARHSENGLEIPLSREDLANSVGMASESVIRTLAAFKKEGLTDTIKRTVILTDTDGLEDELG
jgi:CRP-like cAMP-binding protein